MSEEWRWRDGTPLIFENWAQSEPSGDGPNAVLPFDGSGLWNDIDGGQYGGKYTLCQFSPLK